MNILVTGATGFVGSALLDTLSLCPNYVSRAAVRCVNHKLPSTVDVVQVDSLSADTDWGVALQGVDTVVHIAARNGLIGDSTCDSLTEFRRVNVDGTLTLATQAASAGVKRFVFISSVKAQGEVTPFNAPYSESDCCAPEDPMEFQV